MMTMVIGRRHFDVSSCFIYALVADVFQRYLSLSENDAQHLAAHKFPLHYSSMKGSLSAQGPPSDVTI